MHTMCMLQKIILMCLVPGAEEDKKRDNVTSNYPCLSEREHHTPFKVTEQRCINTKGIHMMKLLNMSNTHVTECY